jgi:hypothetical protein
LVVTKVTYGCRGFLANGCNFENECSYQSEWFIELKVGLLSIITLTTIDSINSTTAEFKGYSIYEFDPNETPTHFFLMGLCVESVSRMNEILNRYLYSATNVDGNKIVPFEIEWAQLKIYELIGKIYA